MESILQSIGPVRRVSATENNIDVCSKSIHTREPDTTVLFARNRAWLCLRRSATLCAWSWLRYASADARRLSQAQPPPMSRPVERPCGRMIATAKSLSAVTVMPPNSGRRRCAAMRHSVPHHAVTPMGRQMRPSRVMSGCLIGSV